MFEEKEEKKRLIKEKKRLIKSQMLKPIIWCELKKVFCRFATKEFCLNLRNCEIRGHKTFTSKGQGIRPRRS